MNNSQLTPPKPIRLPKQHETVAVTIATKNRPTYLSVLLATLAQQTYQSWMLVINDQSDIPIVENPTVKDLLKLIETQGHAVQVMRTNTPGDRYQRVLEVVPASIEFIHRIDDDVTLTPTYLEKIMRPFYFFPDRPLAAVGGCLAGSHMQPMPLNAALRQPGWFPRIDKPTWRLQGHYYFDQEIIEMESLWGCAMCYRRSAINGVGGWPIPGQSQQIFREDSDMSARLVTAGYELMMTTAALGWHLVAPSGGAREVTKTEQGNFFDSHRAEYEADDHLFRERLAQLLTRGYNRTQFHRYRIADLEQGIYAASPLLNRREQAYQTIVSRTPPQLLRLARKIVGR